jgi:broad specificity phosphatase PhoE
MAAWNKSIKKNVMKLNNTYYILRHGQALSNVKGFISSFPEKTENPLTEEGVLQAKKAGQDLQNEKIDLIFSSDVLRAKQTAEIVAKSFNKNVELDARLREIDFGIFNSKPIADLVGHFENKDRITEKSHKGESYKDILKRMESFLTELEKKYKNKKILLVSHQAPLFILEGIFLGFPLEKSVEFFTDGKLLSNCQFKKFN